MRLLAERIHLLIGDREIPINPNHRRKRDFLALATGIKGRTVLFLDIDPRFNRAARQLAEQTELPVTTREQPGFSERPQPEQKPEDPKPKKIIVGHCLVTIGRYSHSIRTTDPRIDGFWPMIGKIHGADLATIILPDTEEVRRLTSRLRFFEETEDEPTVHED